MVFLNASPSFRRIARAGRRTLGLLMAWIAIAALPPPASAKPSDAREYQVKAVFLFNFAQFVEWPPEAFSSPDAPIVIGILGHDPFGAYLDEVVRGETVSGHPLRVERYRHVQEIKACHILYISPSEAGQVPEILAQLRGRSLLTVSEIESFANRSGVIQLVRDRNRIRLRINIDAARDAALTISSKLLRPAEIVAAQ